jgi:energy-coupling factor transporter ATP-binding protein EcfA2
MLKSFELHVLGWKSFEDLVGCIFREVLGQTVQVFSDGVDGGRDAAFKGSWISADTNFLMEGSFCIQCKHTSKPSQKLSMSTISDELEKVERLAKSGLCDNYILVTNYQLPAGIAEKAEAAITSAGAKKALIFGNEWISKLISENPKLRRLVPRLYGLGDLTQIITHQAYRQAREVLDSIAPDLACFVPTGAYRQCALALQEHGFVLLLGEPASGKTMIANLMAISAADEWDIHTLMISGPSDFSRLWNPDDPGQFLWVDDAFGATQYDANRVSEWNLLFPKLKAAIRAGARVVFTSRDYIFASAKRDLKLSSFDLFDDSRVVIKVEALTLVERQMILYNHLKSGSQSIKFKTSVKGFLESASKVPKFLPEIARRFANPKFTYNLAPTIDGVQQFFECPLNVLLDVVRSLAAPEKAAIGLVFIAGGKLPIPVSADEHVVGTLDLLNVTLGQVKAALVSLDDSLLKRLKEGNSEFWHFRHPTIRDAYATVVGENPELIDVYLAGVRTEQLLTEVVCGDISIQGAQIIVPPSRYTQIQSRLDDFLGQQRRIWPDPVQTFLSKRCAPDFIAGFYKARDLSDCMPRGTWELGIFSSGIQILGILNESQFLSEQVRSIAAKKIITFSEQDLSCRFAKSPAVQKVLTRSEIDGAVHRIAQMVLVNGASLLDDIKREWDNESDPADVFDEIDGTFEFIESDERFNDHDRAIASEMREQIKDIVHELSNELDKTSYLHLEAESAEEIETLTTRSIFDDVDQ